MDTSSPKLNVDLVARSGANCLDLGVRWVGRHLDSVLRVAIPFALGAAWLAWTLVAFAEFDLRILFPVLAVVTCPLGMILARRAASSAFDRALRPGRFGRDLGSAYVYRFLGWIGPLLVIHSFGEFGRDGVGAFLFILGVVLYLVLTPRTGLSGSFVAENGVLDPRRRGLASQRTRELVKRERSELFLRWHWWVAYWYVLVAVLLVGLETFLQSMLGWSPLFGRDRDVLLGYLDTDGFGPMIAYVSHSPLAVATLAFVATLVYPLVRVAWTFCYVDLRIRRDLWDLQRRCHQEARLLGETSS